MKSSFSLAAVKIKSLSNDLITSLLFWGSCYTKWCPQGGEKNKKKGRGDSIINTHLREQFTSGLLNSESTYKPTKLFCYHWTWVFWEKNMYQGIFVIRVCPGSWWDRCEENGFCIPDSLPATRARCPSLPSLLPTAKSLSDHKMILKIGKKSGHVLLSDRCNATKETIFQLYLPLCAPWLSWDQLYGTFCLQPMKSSELGQNQLNSIQLYMVTQSQHFILKWCKENNQMWLPRRTRNIGERHELWLTSLLIFKVTCPSLDKRDHICYQELKLKVTGSRKLLRTQYSGFLSDFLKQFLKRCFGFIKEDY